MYQAYRAARVDPDKIKDAKLSVATLKRTMQFARPYRFGLVIFLLLVAIDATLGILPVLIYRRIVDHAIPSGSVRSVVLLAVFALGIILADQATSIGSSWLSNKIGLGLIYDLRSAVFNHMQRMPFAFFTRTQTGTLQTRILSDVSSAQGLFTGSLRSLVADIFGLAAALATMLYLSPPITLVVLAIVPIFITVSKPVGRKMQKLTRDQMKVYGTLSSYAGERLSVGGALLVKLFGSYRRELDGFQVKLGELRDLSIRGNLIANTFYGLLGIVGSVGVVAVYALGGSAVIHKTITLGTLVALVGCVSRAYSPIIDLASTRINVMTSFVAFERVFEVLDAPHTITDSPAAIELGHSKGRIEFDDVWFRYPAAADVSIASLEKEGTSALSAEASDWVLQGVSFSCEPGTMTAIVGPSGAGKTSLSTLVPRLYDVTEGSVRIDGHDVRELAIESLVANIGVVTQDAHLFHDSVATNLRYAKADATDEEVEQACRAARIHDLLDALPERYDTVVGERGYRFSGGEKQRLALARLLLKDPAIMILDEATAHLDSETESLVQEALSDALRGRTSVVIAHRLSTIRAADQILVVDAGRIVERGTHDSLLAAEGLYADLVRTQAFAQLAD